MIRLNQQQLNFFDTFGYLALPGLMADCIDEIIDAFEQVWAERGGGHYGQPHDGERRSCIVPFIDQHERLCALLDDPRIEGLLASLLGDDFNYSGSDGNYYAGDTRWHSDGYQKEIRHVKIAFYLDHLTRDTGCLRVIPGSHRRGDQYAETLEANVKQSQEQWGISGDQVPAVALEINPRRRRRLPAQPQTRGLRRQWPSPHVHHQLHGARARRADRPRQTGHRRTRPLLGGARVRRDHARHGEQTPHGASRTAHGQRRPPQRTSSEGAGRDARAIAGIGKS